MLKPRVQLFAIFFVALSGSGCLGDRVLQKRVLIEQMGTTYTPDKFRVDMSHIPEEWIKQRRLEEHFYSDDVDHIVLDPRHAVKIVLMPDEEAVQNPGDTGQAK